MEGRVRAALRLLAKDGQTGLLKLDQVIGAAEGSTGKTVKEILEEKHPDANQAYGDTILSRSNNELHRDDFHPILFESIDAEVIRNSALRTQGAAEPSGAGAMLWRRFCTAFGLKSNDLCSALAACAWRICTTYVDPSSLMAYTACRLIPLDKCPGVCPIGIGEVVRRIIGKAIMKTTKRYLQNAVGSIQLCAGQEAGCEAAVHAMAQIFDDNETEAMIFVDASNAFNRLNRQVALRNTEVVCPCFDQHISEQFLAIRRWPVHVVARRYHTRRPSGNGYVCHCNTATNSSTPWHRQASVVRRRLGMLEGIGSNYGYLPNGSKTFIVVEPELVETANEIFQGTGISISTEGRRYLGGAIGTTSFRNQLIDQKVREWVEEIKTLSEITKTEPHAAFAAFTHGLSSRWNYFIRVTDLKSLSATGQLQPLENAIRSLFIPGHSAQSDLVRDLLALLANLGGIGLLNPLDISANQHSMSKKISAPLLERVIEQDHRSVGCSESQQQIKAAVHTEKRSRLKQSAKNIQEQFPAPLQRSMELSQEEGASTWLTALPIDNHGFALHKTAFRDALSLRYG